MTIQKNLTSTKRGNIFALILMGFYPIASVLISVIIGLITGGNDAKIEKAGLVVVIIQDLIIILIPVLLYSIVTRTKLKAIIPHEKLSIKNILYIILLTLLMSPIMTVISSVTTIFYPADVNTQILSYINALPMPLCVLALAIMPAIFEELAFRGVVLSNYRSVSLLPAAIVSGLFFGLFHLDFYQMGYAFVAGVFFSFIVRYTNSIYASMFSHFLINGTQVILSKIALTMTEMYGINVTFEQTASTTSSYSSIIAGIFFTAVATPFLIITFKKFMEHNKNHRFDYELSITRKKPEEFEIDLEKINRKRPEFIDIYFIAYVVISIILAIIFSQFK